MATAYTPKSGSRCIDYDPPGFKRQTIRLGVKATADAQHEFKKRIEILVTCKKLGEFPDAATLEWAKRIDRKFYQQLSRVGLLALREVYTLGELCKWFLEVKGRKVAASTLSKANDDANAFLAYAKSDTPILQFTAEDADKFRQYLLHNGGRYKQGLAPATVSRICRRMAEFFNAAIQKRWVQSSPFEAMGHYCERNEENDRYILAPTLQAIIDESTCPRIGLMLALSRYAGLRGVAEFQALKWQWVDWPNNVIKVFAPKNQRHESARWRTVPLCPALKDQLQGLWNIGETMVFPETLVQQNLTSRIEVFCRRAGVPLWPRPFTNLRASCERDWFAAGHPIDAVTSWMGHSPETALKHYNRYVKEQSARQAAANLLQTKNIEDSCSKNSSTETPRDNGFRGVGAAKR